MKRIIGLTLVLVLGAGVAQAYPGLQVTLRKATCSRHSFRFRLDNTNDRAIRFRVVLWNGNVNGTDFFHKATVPANGYYYGVMSPDWQGHPERVSIFRTWQWKPGNQAWRRSHHLITKSADLSGCA